MANTIEYADSPNVDTAFVVQEGGQKNRAVLTAPQDTTTLELPDNPNSTKGYVTVDGKKHKVILTADISGNGGGGGGGSLPDQTNHEGQFLFTNGSTASWSDNVYTHSVVKTYTFDENTTDRTLRITPKANRDCFVKIRVYSAQYDDNTGEIVMVDHSFDLNMFLLYEDLNNGGTPQQKSQVIALNQTATGLVGITIRNRYFKENGGQTTGGYFNIDMTWIGDPDGIPSGEERYTYLEIDYSDGVSALTDETTDWSGMDISTSGTLQDTMWLAQMAGQEQYLVPVYNTGWGEGGATSWQSYPFGDVYGGVSNDYKTVVCENGTYVEKYYSQVTEFPTPAADEGTLYEGQAIFQYLGETDQDYTHGYFYEIQYVLDRNAVATQTTGSSLTDITVNQAVFADWIKTEMGYYEGTCVFTFDGSNWSVNGGGEYADLTDMGITYTGTPVANDVIEVTFDDATWTWVQVNVQPTPEASTAATATLVVADWSSNTQTVNVTGVTSSNNVIVAPAPASQADYTTAGILCTAQGSGTLTFTCTTVPSSAITVNVLII